MHPHCFFSTHRKFIIPNMRIQVLQTEYLPGIAGKAVEQTKFFSGQLKVFTIYHNLPVSGADDKLRPKRDRTMAFMPVVTIKVRTDQRTLRLIFQVQ